MQPTKRNCVSRARTAVSLAYELFELLSSLCHPPLRDMMNIVVDRSGMDFDTLKKTRAGIRAEQDKNVCYFSELEVQANLLNGMHIF